VRQFVRTTPPTKTILVEGVGDVGMSPSCSKKNDEWSLSRFGTEWAGIVPTVSCFAALFQFSAGFDFSLCACNGVKDVFAFIRRRALPLF